MTYSSRFEVLLRGRALHLMLISTLGFLWSLASRSTPRASRSGEQAGAGRPQTRPEGEASWDPQLFTKNEAFFVAAKHQSRSDTLPPRRTDACPNSFADTVQREELMFVVIFPNRDMT